MAKFQIGSYDHKKLFCQLILEHSESAKLQFPNIDELTHSRLQELTVFTFVHDQLLRSGLVAQAFAQQVKGTLLQGAIAQIGQENLDLAKAVKLFCREHNISTAQFSQMKGIKAGESEFKQRFHQNNIGLFLISGLYDLAARTHYLDESLLAALDQALNQQARHVLFFINWLAFESQVRQKPEYEMAGLLTVGALQKQWLSTFKRLNRSAYDDNLPNNPSQVDIFMGQWGYRDLLSACEENYQERFASYDARLHRPKTCVQVSQALRTLLSFWPQRVSAAKAPIA